MLNDFAALKRCGQSIDTSPLDLEKTEESEVVAMESSAAEMLRMVLSQARFRTIMGFEMQFQYPHGLAGFVLQGKHREKHHDVLKAQLLQSIRAYNAAKVQPHPIM